MLRKVLEFFQGREDIAVDSGVAPTEHELRLATGVLLLEMAGADSHYDTKEIHLIVELMKRRFGLSEEGGFELLEIASVTRNEHERIDKFVEILNRNMNRVDKRHILSLIWAVVHADGIIDKNEKRFMTQMRYRLMLSEEDLENAKKEGETYLKAG